MHNKLFVADNKVAIVGGRNIGNEYFGLNKDMNFRDLDLLAAGRIVTDISDSFDVYWNSKWSYPIEVVSLYRSGKDDLARIRDYLQKRIAKKRHYLVQIGTEVRDWTKEIYRLGQRLIQGQARVVYDLPPQGDEIRPKQTAQEILRHARAAESEVLIVSPYFIPTAKGVERLHEVVSRGVRVRILTNSLASNDILIANTAYKRYRKGLVKAGVELYELRADAAQKSLYDTAPVKADYLGLHAKTIVIDQKKVYVGTMNLDPRSLNLNTEVGLIVESPHLATQIQRSFERDLLPQNSWRVELDENDRVIWKSSAGTRLRQPAKNFRQWIKDALLTPFADEDQW